VTAALVGVAWTLAVCCALALGRTRRRLERVARAEHELRGPAAVLLLACERMRREPAARRHARVLEVELERLRAGLAELTAARTGRPRRAEPAAVDLASFSAGAAAGWRAPLREAGRDVRVDWRAGRMPLVADRGRLAGVLANLVANAAEHGDGPVELRGHRVAGGVRVEVRNSVPARARTGLGGEHPAGGRGLAIARDAAAELGGRLSLEAADGTVTAALELPLGDAADADEPPAAEAAERRPADADEPAAAEAAELRPADADEPPAAA
jgi:signal transduction histidine kinase